MSYTIYRAPGWHREAYDPCIGTTDDRRQAEVLRTRTVYLLGEGGHIWSVAMLCPCGCGEQIQVSTVGGRPRWSVEVAGDGAVTLTPSIWRKVGCGILGRAHSLGWRPPQADYVSPHGWSASE